MPRPWGGGAGSSTTGVVGEPEGAREAQRGRRFRAAAGGQALGWRECRRWCPRGWEDSGWDPTEERRREGAGGRRRSGGQVEAGGRRVPWPRAAANMGVQATGNPFRSSVAARVPRRSPPAFGLRPSRFPIRHKSRHVLSSGWLMQCVNRGDGHGQTIQSHR
jgi:hypothetical protein